MVNFVTPLEKVRILKRVSFSCKSSSQKSCHVLKQETLYKKSFLHCSEMCFSESKKILTKIL